MDGLPVGRNRQVRAVRRQFSDAAPQVRKYRVSNVGIGAAMNVTGPYVFWRRDGKELLAVSFDHRSVADPRREGVSSIRAVSRNWIVHSPHTSI